MTVILISLLKNNLVLLNVILYFLFYTFLCMFHPSFFVVPPAIEGDETSYFIVIVNNLLELDCQVTGSPPPTIM